MSTEIINNPVVENKTKDTMSQTLFRFVSLRNPQLTKTDETNKGFIYRPESAKNGAFDTSEILQAKENKIALLEARLNVLLNDSSYANYFYKTEQEVKDLSSSLFELGEKIAKGELENVETSLPFNTSFLETNERQINFLTQLWDNLIYQVLTQESFYVKEAIIQVLKAKHFADNYSSVERMLLQDAKVVLPNELFIDNYIDTESYTARIFTVNESKISEGYIHDDPNALTTVQKERMKVEAEKLSELNSAKLRIEAFENLKKDLQKLQKFYQKSYNKAYKTAYNTYQETNAPLLQARETELANIEAQITETTTEAEKQVLYASVRELEIPAFNFTFKNEVNFSDLQSKLSEESLQVFTSLFAEVENSEELTPTSKLADAQINSDTEMTLGNAVVSLNEDYYTYQNIYQKLDEEISELSNYIFASTPAPKKEFVNIGGVLVPVATGKSSTHLHYTMRANYDKSLWGVFFTINYLQFAFDVEDSSWGVNLAKISAQTSADIVEETYTDIAVVNGKVTFPNALVRKFSALNYLKIELFFDNGREAVLEFNNIINNNIYPGIISLNSINSNGSSSTTGNGNSPKSFMPKHFGVKRLGIADYLKVEQSLHAYVPGEVSNIENVMASELRHKGSTKFTSTETTETTNKTVETEHVSDTTTATRSEMQSEVAKVMEQDRNFEAHTSYGKGNSDTSKGWHFEIGASYASHNSQQTSTRQAVTKAQEVTNRAMDRIVSKVTEERVVKIINQFTEQNTHEFDNRGNGTTPPQHIAGVYRWVDKKYKNQIYNYGKRAMFEFMIPEPAKLHRLANVGTVLTAPIDPRKAEGVYIMPNANASVKVLQYWANYYGVKLSDLPENTKTQTVERQDIKLDGNEDLRTLGIDIFENYTAKSARIIFGHNRQKHGLFGEKEQGLYYSDFNGGLLYHKYFDTYYTSGDTGFISTNITGHYDYSFKGKNANGCFFAFHFNCELSSAFIASWKKENFDTIITAYTKAEEDYQKKKADIEAEQKDKTENFYRDMEEVVLKHNCIAYLLQDYSKLGNKDLIDYTNQIMANFQVNFGEDLDNYTALAKFMEQAFEWNIMSYTFYPYYWGNKEAWKEMYTTESVDPLFRNFLQAGMARVIVTVKPGFEDAVQFFMNTGKIWNGGEVPVIGDPLYLSIVDELREPVGVKQGKAWITRIPTTLNILQAKSIGLEVTEALPISTENPADFENPDDVELVSPFGEPKDIALSPALGTASTLG